MSSVEVNAQRRQKKGIKGGEKKERKKERIRKEENNSFSGSVNEEPVNHMLWGQGQVTN